MVKAKKKKHVKATGVRCPKCDSAEADTLDSRGTLDYCRRRKQCAVCRLRYTTYEMTEVQRSVIAGGRKSF